MRVQAPCVESFATRCCQAVFKTRTNVGRNNGGSVWRRGGWGREKETSRQPAVDFVVMQFSWESPLWFSCQHYLNGVDGDLTPTMFSFPSYFPNFSLSPNSASWRKQNTTTHTSISKITWTIFQLIDFVPYLFGIIKKTHFPCNKKTRLFVTSSDSEQVPKMFVSVSF